MCGARGIACLSIRRSYARRAVNSCRTSSATGDRSRAKLASPAHNARSRAALSSRPTGSSSCKSSARKRGLSVSPWIASVPRTTENAVSTIRSRYGVGRSIGRGGWKPTRRCRHLTTALKGMCQAKRTTITVSRTAPATAKYRAPEETRAAHRRAPEIPDKVLRHGAPRPPGPQRRRTDREVVRVPSYRCHDGRSRRRWLGRVSGHDQLLND